MTNSSFPLHSSSTGSTSGFETGFSELSVLSSEDLFDELDELDELEELDRERDFWETFSSSSDSEIAGAS